MAIRVSVLREAEAVADLFGVHPFNQKQLKKTWDAHQRAENKIYLSRKVFMSRRRHDREHQQMLADNRARAERIRERVAVALAGYEGADPEVTAREIRFLETQGCSIDLAEARNGHSVRSALENTGRGVVIDGMVLTPDSFDDSY